jgi:glycine/D-amino acid oxidase-like deaminating enzyme
LKPDPHNRPASLLAKHGVATAASCAIFEFEVLKAVKTVIEEEKIDCDFVLTRAVDALMSDSIRDKMINAVQVLRQCGVKAMDDVQVVHDAGMAQQVSGVKGAKGCISYPAAHLWPYKLVMTLLEKAVTKGVNLQTHTPVTFVSDTQDQQGYYAVTTQRGALRARKVVFATNGYTSSLLPAFVDKIVPVRGICAHIGVPDSRKPAPLLSNSYMVRHSSSEFEYLIPRLEGGVIVGGGRQRYYKDLGNWYDTVRDDELIESAKGFFDGYMQRTFQGWEDSGAVTERIWTGSEWPQPFSSGCRAV